jgi:hypothetical protein
MRRYDFSQARHGVELMLAKSRSQDNPARPTTCGQHSSLEH